MEHRTPKTIYTRTSRKGFLKQMTQIERRQARIRRIREHQKMNGDTSTSIKTDIATSPNSRYHVGNSQNEPEHIVAFVQKNSGDPAIKVTCFLSVN